MKKVLFVLGIVLIILSLPLMTAPLYMRQGKPVNLALALITPPQITLISSSGEGTIPPGGSIIIMEGESLRESWTLHIEISVTGGANNDANLTIMSSTHTYIYPIVSSITLYWTVPEYDTYYIFINNSDTTERTYSYKLDYYFELSFFKLIFLIVYSVAQEPPSTAYYLEIIGFLLMFVGIKIISFASKKQEIKLALKSQEETMLLGSEEQQKVLPQYVVEKKDKVFYVCEVCGSKYPCDEKNTRTLIELREEALKIVKNKLKEESMTRKIISRLAQREEKSSEASESAVKRLHSTFLDIVDEIQQDASKNLLLCPSCQRWVCKTNCWNKTKGLCITCVSQGKEAKQGKRKKPQAKNYCPYCGTKITDPTQTRCSKCEGLLDF